MKKEDFKERPVECSACQRAVEVKYTQVKEKVTQCFYMCAACPLLAQTLDFQQKTHTTLPSELVCGHCGTSSNELQRGGLLGCASCYETFEAFIVQELKYQNPQLTKEEGGSFSHIGHKPGQLQKISPDLKILALNEALAETLLQENYEQAAWIRDQIKELKNKVVKS